MRGMIASLLSLVLCCGYAAESRANKALAAQLGYEGCKVSKPLSKLEIMARDMSGVNGASRAHPDWDEIVAQYKSGDQVYWVDCRRVDPSRLVAGTSLYVLVRDGAVIARAADTND
jgi:hypothetical protein